MTSASRANKSSESAVSTKESCRDFNSTRRLRAERVVAPLVGKPADEVLEAIFTAASEYGQGRPWVDDTTAVVITRQADSTS